MAFNIQNSIIHTSKLLLAKLKKSNFYIANYKDLITSLKIKCPMKKLFLFLILFSENDLAAQNREYFVFTIPILSNNSEIIVNSRGDTVMVSNFKNSNVEQISSSEFEKEYKGTPFFKNGWYKGVVKLDANYKSEGTFAYNLIDNTVLYARGPNKESIVLTPVEFTLEGHTFRKLNKEYNAAGQSYYERLSNGKVELFKRYICKYHPAVTAEKTGYEQTGDGYEGYFEKEVIYYTIYKDKITVIGNKFKVFEANANKAEAFAKENNLSLKKEADIIKIVSYLNSK
jgi:hypothetical protein